MKAVWSQQGRKAIRELLELTISELEASRVYQPTVFVGSLEIPEILKRSPAQVDAFRKVRRRSRQYEQKPRPETIG